MIFFSKSGATVSEKYRNPLEKHTVESPKNSGSEYVFCFRETAVNFEKIWSKDILVLVKPVDFALKIDVTAFNAKSTGFNSTKMSFDLIFSQLTAVSQKQKTHSKPEFYGLSNDIGHEV
ncbi:hypothetical protein B9Z55_015500 [Caenorhabditis nigoni]|uniref:Uncharacterized protein n=1 Tax=Caenorhabditis nigoni TaxID=1611254 RepID=A0A2G5UAS7_9PELO|nr:hypothetical protein B9Z55_015500 [Caenorhabditis nigoni]